jgi:chromate transporter
MTEPATIASRTEAVAFRNTPSLAALFFSFLGLGATAFGGLAMIVYVKDLAVRKRWMDSETYDDGAAMCQALPGATVMMAVAYVGLKTRGVLGAWLSYVAFVFPCSCGMLFLSILYARSHTLPQIVSLLSGLQVVVVAIMGMAAFKWGKDVMRSYKGAIIAMAAALLLIYGLSPMAVIVIAGLAGMALFGEIPAANSAAAPADGKHGMLKPALVLAVLAVSGLVALYFIDRTLFLLAATMMKINLFAFGGAAGSIPMMLHEVVTVRHWVDGKTMMDAIALSQVTPGPISTSTAFLGYLIAGLPGSAVAITAFYTPSFILLIVMTPYFNRLKSSQAFRKATRGVISSFAGLLCFVTFTFFNVVHWDLKRSLLAMAAALALHKGVHVAWVVLVGGAFSIAMFK